MAQTAEQMVAAIDAKLEALIADPPVDYKEGDVTVKESQAVKVLLDMRKQLLNAPVDDLTIIKFDDRVNEFGIDTTEYY